VALRDIERFAFYREIEIAYYVLIPMLNVISKIQSTPFIPLLSKHVRILTIDNTVGVSERRMTEPCGRDLYNRFCVNDARENVSFVTKNRFLCLI